MRAVVAATMIGRRSGLLTVVAEAVRLPPHYDDRWDARCDCGGVKTVDGGRFRGGGVRSCGCLKNQPRHGHNRRIPGTTRRARSPEYMSWHSAISRCENPKNPSYRHYGGRGIVFCEKWRHDFAAFLADMGPKPTPKHTIDRIDNDGPYSPENCHWATHSEQNRNRRHLGGGPRDESHGCARLNWGQVREMRERHAGGEPTPALAERYGISREQAWRIVTGRAWQHDPLRVMRAARDADFDWSPYRWAR